MKKINNLNELSYRVTPNGDTEPPHSGKYNSFYKTASILAYVVVKYCLILMINLTLVLDGQVFTKPVDDNVLDLIEDLSFLWLGLS